MTTFNFLAFTFMPSFQEITFQTGYLELFDNDYR